MTDSASIAARTMVGADVHPPTLIDGQNLPRTVARRAKYSIDSIGGTFRRVRANDDAVKLQIYETRLPMTEVAQLVAQADDEWQFATVPQASQCDPTYSR
jgi:hypothetical protein